ncbi:hypothetical protein [Cupriavidus sp. USMAHM13]|uniref:hypothetical protein n=1 Tax=Cupriavidus sp. USMAHM13 TaxID=1389192 RepID=UPI0009F1620D|nr:hypothetical protein [Cupriavidus sp. USMAHM13]
MTSVTSATSRAAANRAVWADAEQRCALRRELAGQSAAEALSVELGLQVTFRPISRRDVLDADKWTLDGFIPGWSWDRELTRARRRPRRVEAAVYSEAPGAPPILCGLILGRISNSHVVASIHLLSRAPDPNPLKGQVAKVAIRYLEFCAAAFGCTVASLQRPIPELVAYYKALGFHREVKKKGKIDRLERDLRDDIAAATQGDEP